MFPKNNNDVRVTNNNIQSRIEISDNYLDDEAMLKDCKASDNEETTFSEIVIKINNDIDIYSTSGANN